MRKKETEKEIEETNNKETDSWETMQRQPLTSGVFVRQTLQATGRGLAAAAAAAATAPAATATDAAAASAAATGLL